MGINETRLLENITRDLAAVDQVVNGIQVLVPFFNTTQTTKAGTVILFDLDALGSSIKDIVVSFYLAADAAATFTLTWNKTRAGDLITFTQEAIPAMSIIATPAAARVYRYALGDLAQGLQGQFSIAQDNAGNANNACDAVLTCLLEV